jgi:hypothetical protein
VTDTTSTQAGDSEAGKALAGALLPEALDALVKDAYAHGGALGAQELLNRMTKAVLERSLEAEMTHHLGYEKGDPAGNGSGNSRNGKSTKTVSTTNGPVEVTVPRDRNGSFEPAIVPKRARRLGNIDEAILSLYSRGMTTRDIESHLNEVYGVNASRELISNVTEVVTDEIALWQSRPLDEVYPILYGDGLRLRVKDKGVVTTKVGYLAVGVDVEGRKHALGLWIADTEAAKFWAKVVTDLRNRGVKDILIACCDGLTGLPDAIRSVFPDTVIQTCVVHVVTPCGSSPSAIAKRSPPECAKSTPRPRSRPPRSHSRTSTKSSAPDTPPPSRYGNMPGAISHHSSTIHPSCAGSSTQQTSSRTSTFSSGNSPKTADISTAMRRQ